MKQANRDLIAKARSVVGFGEVRQVMEKLANALESRLDYIDWCESEIEKTKDLAKCPICSGDV